jgi:hypothetical protein
MEEVSQSFSSLRLDEEVPMLYFNEEAYLEKTEEIGADGTIYLWRLDLNEVMTFLLQDRFWRERDASYALRGLKEGVQGNASYDSFCREVDTVFSSLKKREEFIVAIFRLSPHLPLLRPFFSSVMAFLRYDFVDPFQAYKERGYDMNLLLHIQTFEDETTSYPRRRRGSRILFPQIEPEQKISLLLKIVLLKAVKIAQFYVREGLTTLLDLYTLSVREGALNMVDYLLPFLPPLLQGETMEIEYEHGGYMAVLAHLMKYMGRVSIKLEGVDESEFVRKILKRHGGINDREDGESALYRAVYHKKEKIAITLINRGADVRSEDKILLTLFFPSEVNLSLIYMLVSSGAPITEEVKRQYYRLFSDPAGREYAEQIRAQHGDLFEDENAKRSVEEEGSLSIRRRRVGEELEKRISALYPPKTFVVPVEELEKRFCALHPLRAKLPPQELKRIFRTYYPAESIISGEELRAKFSHSRGRPIITVTELNERIKSLEETYKDEEDVISAQDFEQEFLNTFYLFRPPPQKNSTVTPLGWIETDKEQPAFEFYFEGRDVPILEREIQRHEVGRPLTPIMLKYVFVGKRGPGIFSERALFLQRLDEARETDQGESSVEEKPRKEIGFRVIHPLDNKGKKREREDSSFDNSRGGYRGSETRGRGRGQGRGYQGKNFDPNYHQNKRGGYRGGYSELP